MNPDFVKKIRVLSPEFAKQIVGVLDSLPEESWNKSNTVGDDNKRFDSLLRTSDSLRWDTLPPEVLDDWESSLPGAIHHACEFFMQEILASNPLYAKSPLVPIGAGNALEGGSILRYKVGKSYGWHADEVVARLYDRPCIRRVSAVLYLNDDFEGGGTEFVDGTLRKGSPGECVVFPSSPLYIHRGQEVTEGVKYVVTSWMLQEVSI